MCQNVKNIFQNLKYLTECSIDGVVRFENQTKQAMNKKPTGEGGRERLDKKEEGENATDRVRSPIFTPSPPHTHTPLQEGGKNFFIT